MEETTSKKGIPAGAVVGITILAAIIFGAGVYLYTDNKATKERESLNAQITDLQNKISNVETATKPNDETADWKTYTNTKYDYSFKYPDTVTMTASADNSDDLAINPMADGVNVFPVGDSIGNGIFYVSAINIEFTATGIKNYFNPTNPEKITLTPMTIAETSSYKIAILGDSAVVSTFYFIKSPEGAILELTVVNNSKEAQNILSSFQFTKDDEAASIPSDWKTYKNDKYGYEVKYSGTLESLDRDNDRIYISNAQIVGSEGNIITTRVLSKTNLPSCADKTLAGQIKCFYTALEQNPDKISQQKFGDNTFVYADFTNLDTNTRDLMAFVEKGDYIYQFEIIDPASTASEDLFKNILSTFKFSS